MKNRTRRIIIAAFLLLPGTLLASAGEGTAQGGHLEHCKAASSTLDQAISTVDQAGKPGDPAQKDRALTQARHQLADVKEQMSQCMATMGEMGMGDMGEMGDMKGMDHSGMEHGRMNHAGMNHGAMDMGGQSKAAVQLTDPVSGAELPARTSFKSVYAGKAYYFDSAKNKAKFDKDPEAYLQKHPR